MLDNQGFFIYLDKESISALLRYDWSCEIEKKTADLHATSLLPIIRKGHEKLDNFVQQLKKAENSTNTYFLAYQLLSKKVADVNDSYFLFHVQTALQGEIGRAPDDTLSH